MKGANKALADLADLRDDGSYSMLNQVQKDLAFNLSGHVLHSIFWRNISPKGGGTPQGQLAKSITDSFGGDGAG